MTTNATEKDGVFPGYDDTRLHHPVVMYDHDLVLKHIETHRDDWGSPTTSETPIGPYLGKRNGMKKRLGGSAAPPS